MVWWLLGAVLGLWLLANLKRRRPDGDLVSVHPYRRLMPFIMPTRTESQVYMDVEVEAEALEHFLAHEGQAIGANMTHILIAAVAEGLRAHPRLNRFVAGRRLYQRRGRWISFSMKRKKANATAKLGVVKLQMLDGESLPELVQRINDQIDHERSGTRTHADKEYDFFGLFPNIVLKGAAALMKWLDEHHLLPGAFIRDDGLFTSVFIANLGSLNMAAPAHHLYEWGNCPLFLGVGQVREAAVVVDGEVVVRRLLPLRWTFDERVEDGLSARQALDVVTDLLRSPRQLMAPEQQNGESSS